MDSSDSVAFPVLPVHHGSLGVPGPGPTSWCSDSQFSFEPEVWTSSQNPPLFLECPSL